VLACGLGEFSGLLNRPGKRLLDVNVLTHLDCHHSDGGVSMVRRRDDDGVDILLLFEHYAEILVFGRIGIFLKYLPRKTPVHVAKRDYIFFFAGREVAFAHTAYADGGDIELFAGRLQGRASKDIAGQDCEAGNRRGGSCNKISACDEGVWRWIAYLFHGLSFQKHQLYKSIPD
jgi:hypothetical protein